MVRRARFVWLWYWVGMLVVGCASNASLSPTPRSPTLTLLGWTLTPPTATPRSRLLRTPTPLVTFPFMPTPLPLTVGPPNCYETPVGSLWCLGIVHNTLRVPLEGIVVRVYLVDQDGHLLAEAEAACARTMLMPNEQAPYGVMFLSVPASMTGSIAALVQAVEAVNNSIISLTVSDVHFSQRDPQAADSPISVLSKLSNPERTSISDIMVVVTMFDHQGRVTGFRQVRLQDRPALASGETLLLDLTAVPQVFPVDTVQVSAEGRRN